MNIELQTEEKGEILFLTLNRTDKRNALNLVLIQQMINALTHLPPHIKVVVFQANGTVFCAGLDLHEIQHNVLELYKALADLLQMIYNLPCITVAKVHGHVVAGGIALMCACDLAFAEANTIFLLPEMQKGIVPAFVTLLLRKQIPSKFMHELILLGNSINSTHAKRIGLISQIYEENDGNMEFLLEELSKNPLSSIQEFKKLIATLDGGTLKQEFEHAFSFGKHSFENLQQLE